MKNTLLVIATLLGAAQAHAMVAPAHHASGTVLIAAPTANTPATLNQGIWLVNGADHSFSLNLPALDRGQIYEAFLIDGEGRAYTCGKFHAEGGIDSDGSGPYAGPLALNFPPQPGNDFVTLGRDIADGSFRVIVTVEPYPSASANPTGPVLLTAMIPAGTKVGTNLTFISQDN